MKWLDFNFEIEFDIVFKYENMYYNILFEDTFVSLYKAPGVLIVQYPIEEKEDILNYVISTGMTLMEVLNSPEVEIIEYQKP